MTYRRMRTAHTGNLVAILGAVQDSADEFLNSNPDERYAGTIAEVRQTYNIAGAVNQPITREELTRMYTGAIRMLESVKAMPVSDLGLEALESAMERSSNWLELMVETHEQCREVPGPSTGKGMQ